MVLAAIIGVAGAHAAEQPLSIWEQETFSGDWLGLRTALSDDKVDLTLQYVGEGFSVLSSGIHDRGSYEGRLEFSVDTDLEKFMGWRGASTHVAVFAIHDGGCNVADPRNIDAFPTARLFDAWFQQIFFNDRLSIKIGQLGVDLTNFTTETSGGLINGILCWPSVFAANMINGEPAYPLAAPGLRVLVKPSEELSVLGAVLSGDPFRPNCNDAAGL